MDHIVTQPSNDLVSLATNFWCSSQAGRCCCPNAMYDGCCSCMGIVQPWRWRSIIVFGNKSTPVTRDPYRVRQRTHTNGYYSLEKQNAPQTRQLEMRVSSCSNDHVAWIALLKRAMLPSKHLPQTTRLLWVSSKSCIILVKDSSVDSVLASSPLTSSTRDLTVTQKNTRVLHSCHTF